MKLDSIFLGLHVCFAWFFLPKNCPDFPVQWFTLFVQAKLRALPF